EDLVQGLAVGDPLLELGRLRQQLDIRERLELGLERRDVARLLCEALDATSLAETQDLLEPAEARGGHEVEGSVCLSRGRPRTLSERSHHRAVTAHRDDLLDATPAPRSRPRRASRSPLGKRLVDTGQDDAERGGR